MYKADIKEYGRFGELIPGDSPMSCYPLSVIDLAQSGDIFTDTGDQVLIWHRGGFVFLYGSYDDSFLDGVCDLLTDRCGTNDRRFLLISPDTAVFSRFENCPDILIEKRYFFSYPADKTVEAPALPEGFEVRDMRPDELPQITGQVVPLFYWGDAEAFLRSGMCSVVTCEGRVVSWAFSAALCGAMVDIGIETLPEYRGKGLALAVCQHLIRRILSEGRRPVWGCHYRNPASENLAYRLGFVKESEAFTFKKI